MSARSGSNPRYLAGILLGLAFGVATATLLFFRLGGHLLFLPYLGLAPLLAGPALGALLAWAGAVPRIGRVPAAVLALVIASAPYLAGAVEIRLRGDAFAIPADATAIQWKRHPWGERILTFQSAMNVPELVDEVTRRAERFGWTCEYCVYQASTGTGHGSLVMAATETGGPRGRLGFEIWPGDRALYGIPASDLNQVRVFHDQLTKAPGHALVAIALLLFAAMGLGFLTKRNRRDPNGRRAGRKT